MCAYYMWTCTLMDVIPAVVDVDHIYHAIEHVIWGLI